MCSQGVGDNSIQCKGCKHWMHWRKCSGEPGHRAVADPLVRCGGCLGTVRSIQVRRQMMRSVQMASREMKFRDLQGEGGIILGTEQLMQIDR